MRRRLALAVVGVACVVILAFVLTRQREPPVDGHPISYWMDKLGGSASERVAASNAFRKLGTNAVPWLVEQLKAKDSKVDIWLQSLAAKQSLIRFNWRSAQERRESAKYGFEIIPDLAQDAVPD